MNKHPGWVLLALMAVVILLQLPLLFNPGYFSHDELQWAARANVSTLGDLPWESWLAVDTYQYRPMTFNLWLVISYFSFDQPYLFHAVLVVWGAVNTALLFNIARLAQLTPITAIVGTLVFVTSPYALYVHGWVATIADMLVMSAVLCLLMVIIKTTRTWLIVLASVLLTTCSLLSKESALAIPAIIGVCWLFDGFRARWLIAAVTAGLVAVFYLGLRLPVLLQQPDHTHYTLSLGSAPWRWLEYYLYWIIPNAEEPHTTLARGWRSTPVAAGLLILTFLLAIWQAHSKLALAFLLGGIATLLPVLPIASSAGQYGYLFAAWCVMLATAIWKFTRTWHKVLFCFLAFLSIVHGVQTIKLMRTVGQIQSVYSPALSVVVAQAGSDENIRLQLQDESDRWLFTRLSHEIHSYQGVEIANRVQILTPGQPGDYLIHSDGQITAVNPD